MPRKKKAKVSKKSSSNGRLEEAARLRELAAEATAAFDGGELDLAEERLEAFLALEGTDARWGLSMLQSVARRRKVAASDDEERARHAARELELRDAILALGGDEDAPWLHQWEHARQLNALAWEGYESGEALEKALGEAEASLCFWPYFLPHQDTRVRLLLSLGRTEEAWETVRWVEALHPGWPDFEDIVADPDYARWLEANRDAPLQLPEGRVTAAEVRPEVPDALRTPEDVRLSGAEMAALATLRFGDDEWHRARNDALVALALDASVDFDMLVECSPRDVDLTRGVWMYEGEEVELARPTTERLRHWMLFGFTNHPTLQAGGFASGGPKRLFLHRSLAPMTAGEAREVLAVMGAACGIAGLTPERCAASPFARFGSVAKAFDAASRPQPPENGEAGGRAVATVFAWRGRGEDTYIPYAYEVEGRAYAFAYLTPYDELHRYYGNHPEEWYDALLPHTSFEVVFDLENPARHRATAARLEPLAQHARAIGTSD